MDPSFLIWVYLDLSFGGEKMVKLQYNAIITYEIDTDTQKVRVLNKFVSEKKVQKASTNVIKKIVDASANVGEVEF